MNIVCIKGNSYLIQRSLASLRMIVPAEAASGGNTQHLLQGGSNCKASPALSKEVNHLTSKGPIQIQLVCNAMNNCEHTYCVATVLHGWPRTQPLKGHCTYTSWTHWQFSADPYNYIYNFGWLVGHVFSWFVLGFLNLVVSGRVDSALGLRLFQSTTIYTQYQKYKGILSHFHLTNHIPFLFLLLQ